MKLYETQDADITNTLAQLRERDKDRLTCPYRYLLNFSDAGVGKTVETVECVKRLRVNSVLVLCPKSIQGQWREALSELGSELEVTISGYEMWRNKGEIKRYDCVILDELHKVKNRNALITLKVWNLRSKYPDTVFIGLTATPIRNRPTDIWSVLHCVGVFGTHPNYNGWKYTRSSYWAFCNRYYTFFDNGFTKVFNGYSTDNFDELMQLINERAAPIRRTLSLEAVSTHEIVELPFTEPQAKLYNNIKKLIFESLPPDIKIQNGLVKLLRLMQVTSCPHIVDDSEEYGVKFDWVLQYIKKNHTDNPIIFTRFRGVVKELVRQIPQGIRKYTYHGGMSDAERQLVTSEFQKFGGVFIATIGAAGTGLDGLQHMANTMIFIDRDFSPSMNQQAEARLYRTGQTNDVKIIELRVPGSVDDYVEKLLGKKQEDFAKLMLAILQ